MFPNPTLLKLEHDRRVAAQERYNRALQDPRRIVPRRRVYRPQLLQAIIRVLS